ncbi:MAG: GNAT family N-acetyltransferase [Ignavibacteriales bacterium]|nr:GNAT family N-acetyltransferase [Ignavibacteriales bacterium]
MSNVNPVKEVPILETGRLLLRELTVLDTDDIFEYASQPETIIYLPWESHKSQDDTLSFLKMVSEKFSTSDNINWGIEFKSKRKIIGSIEIRKWNDINRCGDIGYALSPAYWNKGIMSEALRRVIKFAFEELNLNRVEAHCDENNTGSYRVMEKAGMKYEGTLRQKVFVKGQFVSMKLYSLLQSEYNS